MGGGSDTCSTSADCLVVGDKAAGTAAGKVGAGLHGGSTAGKVGDGLRGGSTGTVHR